jgi:transcriptional regulator with XRE-family HTH domain
MGKGGNMTTDETAACSADETVEAILDALRECRTGQGMSQSLAARRMHCAKSTISMLETGTRRALLVTVLRYARMLGAEVTVTVTTRAGRQVYRS